MVKSYSTIVFSLIYLFCVPVSSQEKQAVTLGLLVFPPEIVIDAETGKCLGAAIDITKLALNKFEVDVVCAPPARLYKLIEQGVVDLTVNIKSTEALKDKVVFTDIPYRNLVLNLYGHEGISDPGSISAIRSFDYNGLRVELIDKGFEFIDLPTSTDAIRMFVRGRSDYLLSYNAPASFLIEEFPSDYTVTEMQSIPTFYAVSKTSTNHDAILAQLNNVADTLALEQFHELLVQTR